MATSLERFIFTLLYALCPRRDFEKRRRTI